jgi:predicted Zn-dependent protease
VVVQAIAPAVGYGDEADPEPATAAPAAVEAVPAPAIAEPASQAPASARPATRPRAVVAAPAAKREAHEAREARPARAATARATRSTRSGSHSSVGADARERARAEVEQASDEILVGQTTVAMPRLRRALDLDPSNGTAALMLGQVHLKRGSFGPAARYLAQAAQSRPRDVALLVSLGTAYLESDAAGKAVRVFRKALKLDPGHAAARRGLERARQLDDQPDDE